MLNNRRWLYRDADRPQSLPPLPMLLAGSIDLEMIDRQRRSIQPLDELLLYRIEKINLGELL